MAKYRLVKNRITGIRAIINTITKEIIKEDENPIEYKELRKKALNNLYQSQRNEALKSLGLTRVKGSNGGIYWE